MLFEVLNDGLVVGAQELKRLWNGAKRTGRARNFDFEQVECVVSLCEVAISKSLDQELKFFLKKLVILVLNTKIVM